MPTLTVKKGDLFPDVTEQITDADDTPVDLTGAGVTFSMWAARAPATIILEGETGEVVDGATGRIAYRWSSGDTDLEPGTYEGVFLVTPQVGDPFHVPTTGVIVIYVESRGPGAT